MKMAAMRQVEPWLNWRLRNCPTVLSPLLHQHRSREKTANQSAGAVGGVIVGTLVRLRDIGDSSPLGLVKCMDEEEREWLEVTELLDRMVSIQSPQVGQLVAFVFQTRTGTRMDRT